MSIEKEETPAEVAPQEEQETASDVNPPASEGSREASVVSKKSAQQKAHDTVGATKKLAEKGVRGALKGTEVTGRCIGLCICNIPNKWPRSYTIFTGIFLPIFVIMIVSMGLGLVLSNYEMDNEIESNNIIMYNRAEILKRQILDRINFEMQRDDLQIETIQSRGVDESWDVDTVRSAVSSLSFNWIRCWNHTEVDLRRVYFPTKEQVSHAHPDSQRDFFIDEYWRSFIDIFRSELDGIENVTDEMVDQAYDVAQTEATGEEGCEENFAGTAWFWFTVMTTVGYGNQAPSTSEGRTLIYTAGFFSILMFAVTLGFAGYILSSIIDDIVQRTHVEFISWPSVGCVIWGACWMAWMLVIAASAGLFYGRRLGDEDFASGADLYWFAYISTTTVGLGDFFLQPEVVFASDTVSFGVQFLVGFVFASTFFAKLGELVTGMVPNLGTRLPDQLKTTRLFHYKPSDFGIRTGRAQAPPLTSSQIARDERISTLQELVDEKDSPDDGSSGGTRNYVAELQLLNAEEDLLRKLLDAAIAKREHAVQELEFEGVGEEESAEGDQQQAESSKLSVEGESEVDNLDDDGSPDRSDQDQAVDSEMSLAEASTVKT